MKVRDVIALIEDDGWYLGLRRRVVIGNTSIPARLAA
jgi:hypothetical protein